ncbi:AAA family ATPase [Rhizobium lusitanum]|uniref:ATP-dependent Zn protease n=1 Tax=Rhizobium lusitanum TaxID=293958 RepID=A0A7X0IVF9_9HYPH|nr:AAA family ATPase [Rhizobium lusitanum]MBB6487946.1 ATP-dependent Zn protease [Rhizobium lusitanum]
MSIDMPNEIVRNSVKHYALYRTVIRALSQIESFLDGGPGIVALLTPPGQRAEDYLPAAGAYLYDGTQRADRDALGILCVGKDEKARSIEYNFQSDLSGKTRAILISEVNDLPSLVVVAVEAIIRIEPINERDLREACKRALNVRVTVQQATKLLSFPQNAMFAALRRNRTAAEAIKRLSFSSVDRSATSDPAQETQPRLEDLHGYGEAKIWGLQLAADLDLWRQKQLAWSDVDRGLLLSGPPGVGKTIFAQALALTCNVHFIATSVAQWQATGHLGDTLKAMRTDFANASANTPSIIFLDELDSIGDRSTFPADHANYSTQVVNSLLECLDGTSKRDGVIVVGATNHPDKIDPAVRRPGRLDRHVVIGLPNLVDRIAIIRQLLGSAAPSELGELGLLTESMAGADLAQLVREAKRRARRQRRGVGLEDLTSQLPPLIHVIGEFRRSAAVHEAGHTIVGIRLGYGKFRGAFVHRQLNPRFSEQQAGAAGFDVPIVLLRNDQSYRDQICVTLAGIAAERLIFGSHSNGGEADLAEATRLALEMETTAGMGTKLLYLGNGAGWEAFGPQQVPWLIDKVNEILRFELARAQDVLASDRTLLVAVGDEIDKEAHLSPQRFAELDERFGLIRRGVSIDEKASTETGRRLRNSRRRAPASEKEVRS